VDFFISETDDELVDALIDLLLAALADAPFEYSVRRLRSGLGSGASGAIGRRVAGCSLGVRQALCLGDYVCKDTSPRMRACACQITAGKASPGELDL